MTAGTLERLSAFTTDPKGGNPAGVWIGETLPSPQEMQKIAAEVGFSETAFIAPTHGCDRTIRYYSPEIEIPFCGHATIASGVALGEKSGEGTYQLSTSVGVIPVETRRQNSQFTASLTSVEPSHELVATALLTEVLSTLHWTTEDLNTTIPPATAYAGAWHLVLAVTSLDTLNALEYNFDALKSIMQREGWITLQLIWQESETVFHSRNPFPVGGVVEDPATGAAAAALGGYLRDATLISAPATVLIYQGDAMGCPSQITVDIPTTGGIVVTGNAVRI